MRRERGHVGRINLQVKGTGRHRHTGYLLRNASSVSSTASMQGPLSMRGQSLSRSAPPSSTRSRSRAKAAPLSVKASSNQDVVRGAFSCKPCRLMFTDTCSPELPQVAAKFAQNAMSVAAAIAIALQTTVIVPHAVRSPPASPCGSTRGT